MEFSKREITLKDVAARAGVEKSTAGKALRGDRRIAPATRARVKAVADLLGYRPNPLLSKLAAQRWRGSRSGEGQAVGLVSCTRGYGIRNSLRVALVKMAQEVGYRLESFAVTDLESVERVLGILEARGIEGVLLGPLPGEVYKARVPWDRFSVLSILSGHAPTRFHGVRMDLIGRVTQSWERALELGARAIGMVVFDEPEEVDGVQRIGTFLHLQGVASASSRPIPILRMRLNHALRGDGLRLSEPSLAELERWTDLHRPDAVLGQNSLVYWWLQRTGRPPARFYDLSSDMGEMGPGAEGFRTAPEEIAAVCLDWLNQQIRRGVRGVPQRPYYLTIPSVPSWRFPDCQPPAKGSA